MKTLSILALSTLLLLSACDSPATPIEETDTASVPVEETEEIKNEEDGYTLGLYKVNFEIPEGMQVSSSTWNTVPTALFIDEEDLSTFEGDGLFQFHQITLNENESIESVRSYMEESYEGVEPLSIELEGETYERILFSSSFGNYEGVIYLKETGNDVFVFTPASISGEVTANSEADLQMIEIIKSFEVLDEA